MELIKSVIDKLLDEPLLFNYVRFILAGKQVKMKGFIKKNLEKYKCETIADFCCGTGDFAQPLPEKSTYVGLDINDRFISYAKYRYKDDKKKKFIKADVMNVSKTQKKADASLLISAVHHFSDEELKILLPSIRKVTKKVLLVADIIPDPPFLFQKICVKLDRGRFVRSREEKIKILRKYFNIVKTELIPTRSAVQFGIVCEIKGYAKSRRKN